MDYDIKGQLMELTHRDQEGVLDCYVYGYDLMGNKTTIEKQRRGLPEESGAYAYRYDAMGRLAGVSKDGQPLRTYEYDAFGNRSLLREGGRETAYVYNAMNQLIQKTDVMNEETYAYDKRGNLSLILENGDIRDRYLYGALNRLEQAVNGKGEAATYTYNGLGHRVGKMTGAMEGMAGMQDKAGNGILKGTDVMDPLSRLKEQTIRPETKIEYTIDLTRQYHNLLEKEEGGNTQSYLWDGNVAGMREETGKGSCYYLQDELGSPIRLMDWNGELTESYGYDEFGQELYGNREETAGRSLTGSIQPFGYTGYQYDKTAGTYYAQAREYRAEIGRFAAVDTIKGFAAAPYTLNEYGYCWGNPMVLVDLDGAWPQWIIDAFNGDGSEVPEWLERIIEGDEAHRLLQARFIQDYGGQGGVTEYYIGSGINSNKSGTGRADIVYFNSMTRSAEVYEIKPMETYGPGKRYYDQGVSQMGGYVEALNKGNLYNNWRAKPGMTLNGYFDTITIPNKLFKGKKDIVYHVYENGMIGYRYVDSQPKKEPAVVTEDVKEKLEEWQRNLSELWGKYGGEIIISYALICALVLTVATQGAALPASAAAIIILLLVNRELVNQAECDVS